MNVKTSYALIAKFLDFLDQWIKLLLSWLFLCDNFLKTMYISTSIYLSIDNLSLNAIYFKCHFLKISSLLLPPEQIVPTIQILAHSNNVRHDRTMSSEPEQCPARHGSRGI
jgi:hypothetical protein